MAKGMRWMPQRSVFVFTWSLPLLLYYGSRSLPTEKSPQLQICAAIRRRWKFLLNAVWKLFQWRLAECTCENVKYSWFWVLVNFLSLACKNIHTIILHHFWSGIFRASNVGGSTVSNLSPSFVRQRNPRGAHDSSVVLPQARGRRGQRLRNTT